MIAVVTFCNTIELTGYCHGLLSHYPWGHDRSIERYIPRSPAASAQAFKPPSLPEDAQQYRCVQETARVIALVAIAIVLPAGLLAALSRLEIKHCLSTLVDRLTAQISELLAECAS